MTFFLYNLSEWLCNRIKKVNKSSQVWLKNLSTMCSILEFFWSLNWNLDLKSLGAFITLLTSLLEAILFFIILRRGLSATFFFSQILKFDYCKNEMCVICFKKIEKSRIRTKIKMFSKHNFTTSVQFVYRSRLLNYVVLEDSA